MVKIITIGGTAGSGKSTIAKEIAVKTDIKHIIGTGFVREILKRELDVDAYNYHTYADVSNFTPYEFLVHQTELMKDSIEVCIDRAEREGTDIIIEGNHCIPWILNNHKVTNSFILYVVDKNHHWKYLHSSTHSKRIISDTEFERIREIQHQLVSLAQKYKVPAFEYHDAKRLILEEL